MFGRKGYFIMKKGTLRETAGFTLLEILVALAVMAIAVTIIIQLFSANLRAVSRAGGMTAAAIRADARMRELLLEPVLAEKSWSEETDDGYRLDASIAEVLKERTDNLPVKLMEVILTIHWMEGRKEKSISLQSQKIAEKATQDGKNFTARN
jgi:general secretion pathway protein I